MLLIYINAYKDTYLDDSCIHQFLSYIYDKKKYRKYFKRISLPSEIKLQL